MSTLLYKPLYPGSFMVHVTYTEHEKQLAAALQVRLKSASCNKIIIFPCNVKLMVVERSLKIAFSQTCDILEIGSV